MRAIAIVLVVLVHGSFILNSTLFDRFPWIRLLDGVELFFVLSGFLIGGILIRTVEKHNGLSGRQLAVFWKRRWFRTLPPYFLILCLNWLFLDQQWIEGDPEQFGLRYFLFLQNMGEASWYDFPQLIGFFWESWSLSIEEWFYLLLPLSMILTVNLMGAKKGLFVSMLVMMIVPLVYRIQLSDLTVDAFWWDVTFRKTVFARLDTIMYGVLAAWVCHYFPFFWSKYRTPAFILGIIILWLAVNIPKDVNSMYAKTWYFNLLSIGVMLLLPLAHHTRSFRNRRWGRAVTHISKISYSMYLINLGLVAQVIMHQFPVKGPTDAALKYLIYWTIVVGVSTLLYRYFERPVMRFRDRVGPF